MQEGSYTELFFLDEATAFSAGHRPCGQCRRERFKAFKAAWLAANRTMLKGNVETTRDIDRALHADRTTADGQMARWEATFRELPSGAFIENEGRPALKWKNHLLPWRAPDTAPRSHAPSQPDGYSAHSALNRGDVRSGIRAIRSFVGPPHDVARAPGLVSPCLMRCA